MFVLPVQGHGQEKKQTQKNKAMGNVPTLAFRQTHPETFDPAVQKKTKTQG